MRTLISVIISLGAFSCLGLGGPVRKRQDRTQVDEETYDNLSYYAGFPIITGILANDTCSSPSNGAELIQYININSTDTQAALWRSTEREEIIVGIPGTASDEDSDTDFDFKLTDYESPNVDCPDCRVHTGFLGAWNSLYPVLADELTAALDANPGYSTVISGHSLGGALATLAFPSLVNGSFEVTAAYTYGSPRTGDSDFAEYIDELSGASDTETGIFYRVTHDNDGVPHLPPRLFGYQHSRTEFWESEETPEQSSTYRCYGNEPSDCNNSQLGIGSNDAHSSYAGMDITCE